MVGTLPCGAGNASCNACVGGSCGDARLLGGPLVCRRAATQQLEGEAALQGEETGQRVQLTNLHPQVDARGASEEQLALVTRLPSSAQQGQHLEGNLLLSTRGACSASRTLGPGHSVPDVRSRTFCPGHQTLESSIVHFVSFVMILVLQIFLS